MRFLPLILSLTACDVLQQKINEIENLANGFVVGGVFIGVEDVDNDLLDLSQTEFSDNAQLTVYLTAAEISSDLTANPISRADVFLNAATLNNFEIPESEETFGSYISSSADGLIYTEGEEATLDITHAAELHAISISVPFAPTFDLPTEHTLGQNITIDLTGQNFYEALIVVVRIDTGEVTYERRPTDIESLYEYAHPGGVSISDAEAEYMTTVEIPAQAFPNNNLYAIAVAGIQASGNDQMDNINPLLSSFIAGKFRIKEFCVPNCDLLSQIPQE